MERQIPRFVRLFLPQYSQSHQVLQMQHFSLVALSVLHFWGMLNQRMQQFFPIDLSVLHFLGVLSQRMQQFSTIDSSVLHFWGVLNQRMQQFLTIDSSVLHLRFGSIRECKQSPQQIHVYRGAIRISLRYMLMSRWRAMCLRRNVPFGEQAPHRQFGEETHRL